MPRDAEFDKLMYGSAGPPKGVASAPPATETAASDISGGLDPSGRVGRGSAKSIAGTAVALPRLANQAIGLASPSLRDRLGDLAERIPGVKRLERFADEPFQSAEEKAGYYGTEGAQFLFGPGELKLGAKLLGKLPKAAKFSSKAAEGAAPARAAESFVAEAPGGEKVLSLKGEGPIPGGRQAFEPVTHPAARTAERGIDFAARGALAGAITDPQDPGTGAVTGAVTGGALPLAGKALQSKPGQWIAGQIARRGPYAAIDAIAQSIGIPSHLLWETGIAEAILFYHAPGGKILDPAGRKAASWLGRALTRTNPLASGAVGGSLADLAEQQ